MSVTPFEGGRDEGVEALVRSVIGGQLSRRDVRNLSLETQLKIIQAVTDGMVKQINIQATTAAVKRANEAYVEIKAQLEDVLQGDGPFDREWGIELFQAWISSVRSIIAGSRGYY